MKDSDPFDEAVQWMAEAIEQDYVLWRNPKQYPFSALVTAELQEIARVGLDAIPPDLLARLAVERGGLVQVTQMRPPRPGSTQPQFAMKSEVWMDGVPVYRISEEKAE